jgi:hypothetical protein
MDPDEMGIMRVDLTADLEGVPVDFFKRHSVVKCKQTRRQHLLVEHGEVIAKGMAETLYSGVKPNQIRIYDKTAERRMQYQKYCNRFARESGLLPKSAEKPKATTFEELYGHGMWDTITRVERQVAARDVEKMGIETLRSLRLKADLLDPFAKMVFFNGKEPEPTIEHWGFRDWHCGMDLRQRVEWFGLADVERQMKAELKQNYPRQRKHFAPFLRLTSNVVGIDSQGLRNAYATSTRRQLLRAA